METTSIEIGGLVIRAPVTAGTNLVLAVQCFIYFRSLRAGPGARSRLWGGFFSMMAIATLAGVLKHGFQHELSETGLLLVLWVTNVAGGIATYYAQSATAVTHAPEHLRRRFDRVFQIQFLVFLGANVALGPEILLLVVNIAAGLLPVIVVEVMALRRGHPGSGWVVGGLSLSILTARGVSSKALHRALAQPHRHRSPADGRELLADSARVSSLGRRPGRVRSRGPRRSLMDASILIGVASVPSSVSST